MIKAGDLDRQITILTHTSIEDDFGQPHKAWTPFATVRAAKRNLSSRDVMRQQGVVNAATGKFVIRWREGINTSQRISFDGQTFEIESVEEIGRKVGLTIFVRAA